MLTPLDIQNHEFKKGFRGYNENEVDEFLDKIVADYEKILRENEKLKEKAGANDKELNHYKGLEQNLQDTLIVAQKTAEDVLNTARKNAKEIRDNANNEAQNIHENTIREAQNIRIQAQLDAKQMVDETILKLNAATMEYDKLVRDKNTFLWKMRSALESELAVITQLQNSIPSPIEIESMKLITKKVVQDLKQVDAEKTPVKPDNSPTVKIEKVDPKKVKAEKVEKTEKVEKPAPVEDKTDKKDSK